MDNYMRLCTSYSSIDNMHIYVRDNKHNEILYLVHISYIIFIVVVKNISQYINGHGEQLKRWQSGFV